MRRENRIGDRAKNELLEEVVAFANDILQAEHYYGRKESDAKPGSSRCELHRYHDALELADRLRMCFEDCVEPQIQGSRFSPCGPKTIVAGHFIEVGRSRLAPHRVTTTLKCPVRLVEKLLSYNGCERSR